MKKIILMTLISTSILASIKVNILNPCTGKIKNRIELSEYLSNVGMASVEALEEMNLDFRGNENSIVSIYNTPSGMDAFEIVSPTEMRAYGWCYSVNGFSPELMPNEFELEEEKNYEINWHYGYALYKDGEWVTQCTPAWTVIPNLVCSNE